MRKPGLLSLYDAMKEQAKLPFFERKDSIYQKVIDNEYASCRELEKKWAKNKLSSMINSIKDWKTCCLLVHLLCEALGERPVERIFWDDKKALPGAGAHYSCGVLYFYSESVSIKTIIHELTHHFLRRKYRGHQEKFCETEQILFDTLDQLFREDKLQFLSKW